jgi:hypothetical protein
MATYTAFRAGLTLEQAAAVARLDPAEVASAVEDAGVCTYLDDAENEWHIVEDEPCAPR